MRAPAASASRPARSAERFRLDGPSIVLDPRVHAFRSDIADVALAGSLFAPHYARPEFCTCIVASTAVRRAPSGAAAAVSELIHGEAFAVIDIAGDWAWGYCRHDHYVGYVETAALAEAPPPTHIVSAPAALLFSAPDIKAPVMARWPMGARFAGRPEGAFIALEQGFVHHRHARALGDVVNDPVTAAEALIGAPYRWGGRSGDGLDCSGLVQLSFALAGVPAPRDSDQQAATLGRQLTDDEPAERGDLIFFPGHVGLMADAVHLVHANAHWMAVVSEPLADVVARGAVITVRRRP